MEIYISKIRCERQRSCIWDAHYETAQQQHAFVDNIPKCKTGRTVHLYKYANLIRYALFWGGGGAFMQVPSSRACLTFEGWTDSFSWYLYKKLPLYAV
jgi:hypothetical protein